MPKEFSKAPLTGDESAEVREVLYERAWRRTFWAKAKELAERGKLIVTLAPWAWVLYLVAGERLREFLGW